MTEKCKESTSGSHGDRRADWLMMTMIFGALIPGIIRVWREDQHLIHAAYECSSDGGIYQTVQCIYVKKYIELFQATSHIRLLSVFSENVYLSV